VATAPDSTKISLRQRLISRARERWPELTDLHIRHRGAFAYVTGELHDGTTFPLFRLRYNGSATIWGIAIYRASHDDYEAAFLPGGYQADIRLAHLKKRSTAPAASTSRTPPPGNPRRTNGFTH
jgi:hypothetical protein